MLCEPPYTERYVRWCEGTVDKLIIYLLLDPGPDIFDKDIEAVVKVIKTRYLSIRPRAVQFKKKVNEYIGINSILEINSTA